MNQSRRPISSSVRCGRRCGCAWLHVLLLAWLGLLLLPSAAFAQEQWRVEVFPLDGGEAPEIRARLHAQLREAVESDGRQIATTSAQDTLQNTLALIGCAAMTPQCLSELADVLDADYLLFGSTRAAASGTTVNLTLFEAATRAIQFTAAVDAPVPDPARRFHRSVRSLLRGQGVIVVDAGGRNITVSLDDVPVDGLLISDVATGAHVLTLTYSDGRRTTQTVDMDGPRIVRVVPSVPNQAPPGRARRIAGYTLLGAGVAVAAGAVGSSLQVRDLQRQFDETTYQRRAQSIARQGDRSAATATGLWVGAGVFAATGVGLLVWSRTNDVPASAVAVTGSGLLVRW